MNSAPRLERIATGRIEALESRIAPAVTIVPNGQTLNINSDGASDTVIYALDPLDSTKINVTANGGATVFVAAKSAYKTIVFNDGAGNDRLVFDYGLGDPLTNNAVVNFAATGGPDADMLAITNLATGTAALSLSNTADVSGVVTINGGTFNGSNLTGGFEFSGVKTLSITTFAGPDAFTLDAAVGGTAKLSGTASTHNQLVTYVNTSDVTINLGVNDAAATADSFTVNALSGTGLKNLTLTAGKGNDQLTIAATVPTLALPASGGAFTFNGGTESDRITATANVAMSLDQTTLTYADGSELNFTQSENFTLNAASVLFTGTSGVSVVVKPSATTASKGDLAVSGGAYTGTVSYSGPLTVTAVNSLTFATPTVAGGGNDDFTLDVSSVPGALHLSGSVAGNAALTHDLTFSSAQDVTIDLRGATGDDGGTDTLHINAIGAPNQVLLNLFFKLGDGNDSVVFSGVNSFALPVGGGVVALDSGTGTDSFEITATTNLPGGKTYTLNNAQLTLSDASFLLYSGLELFKFHNGPFAYNGTGTEAIVWVPDVAHDEAGLLTFTGSTGIQRISFDGPLFLNSLASVRLNTPGGADDFTLGQAVDPNTNTTYLTLAGTVAGRAHTHSGNFTGISSLTVDLGSNESTAATSDTLHYALSASAPALANLVVSTGFGDDLLDFQTVSPNLPAFFTFDGGGGTDTIRATATAAFALTPNTLNFGGGGLLPYASVEQFQLTGTSFSFDGVTDVNALSAQWTPSALAAKTGTLVIGDGGQMVSTVSFTGDLTVTHVDTFTLKTPAGADRFGIDPAGNTVFLNGTVAGSPGLQQLGKFSSVNSLIVDLGSGDTSPQADEFTIGVGSTGLSKLMISTGSGDDSLTIGGGSFGVKTGGSILFDLGAGTDTLTFDAQAALTLTLRDGNAPAGSGTLVGGLMPGTPLRHVGVEIFDLTSTPLSDLTIIGSAAENVTWTPSGTVALMGDVTSTGVGLPTQTIHYVGGLTVFQNLLSLTLLTPAGADEFFLNKALGVTWISRTAGNVSAQATFISVPTLILDFGTNDGTAAVQDALTIDSFDSSLHNLTVKTGAGDDLLILGAGLASLPSGTFNFDAGTGMDTVRASADVSMAFNSAGLDFQDNTISHHALGHIGFTGNAVENLELTGGPSANRFQVGAWSGTVTLDAGAGDDLIDFAPTATSNFTGTGVFHGGADNDTFILQNSNDIATHGAGGGAFIDGGTGTDTLKATANINFRLTDTSLLRLVPKTGATIPASGVANTLSSIEAAVLQGGSRPNVLDAVAFSGTADLAGEGSVDNLLASRGGGNLYGFHLGNAAATVAERRNVALFTRDNFFISEGTVAATDSIYATTILGNAISFRYFQSSTTAGVSYTLPDAAGGSPAVVSASGAPALGVTLAAGRLSILEGSTYHDTLTGNRLPNILSGLAGDDTLVARGVDIFFGGLGRDIFRGFSPFRFQEATFSLPNTTGALAVPAKQPVPGSPLLPAGSPELDSIAPVASIIAFRA